jgi:diguanylate cyclase (GGDEF)-like protein
MTTHTANTTGAWHLSEELRDAVLDNLSDGVYFVDRKRRILYWNKGAEQITGYSADEVLGRRCRDNLLNHCDEKGTQLCVDHCPLLATMRDGRIREAQVYLCHKSGERRPVFVRAAPVRNSDGQVVGAVETFHDDSAELVSLRYARDLERTSAFDALTTLGNRRFGETTLSGWAENRREHGWPFGLLFADIDSFRQLNDRLGHEGGDYVLRILAGTLSHMNRFDDEVVRWGGDEFVVLVGEADASTLRTVGERVVSLARQIRLTYQNEPVDLTVSVGGVLAGPDETAESVLQRADALLFRSKQSGGNRATFDTAEAPAN